MYLLHYIASQCVFAANLPLGISWAILHAEVYIPSISVSPVKSKATFIWRSDSLCPAIPECPGTQWISISITLARIDFPLWLRCLVSPSLGADFWCAHQRLASCTLLKMATIFTQCRCSGCQFSRVTSCRSPIAHSQVWKTSMCPEW